MFLSAVDGAGVSFPRYYTQYAQRGIVRNHLEEADDE
jgi:hypothetical protein